MSSAIENPSGYRISAGTRPGYVEVHFDEKPARDVLDELKGAGFRWARRSSCWYGKKERLPPTYAAMETSDVPSDSAALEASAAQSPTENHPSNERNAEPEASSRGTLRVEVALEADSALKAIVTGKPVGDARAYYVSAVDGPKSSLLLGPFNTHAEAAARVQDVSRYCNKTYNDIAFVSWGTCGYIAPGPLPIGKLNSVLGLDNQPTLFAEAS